MLNRILKAVTALGLSVQVGFCLLAILISAYCLHLCLNEWTHGREPDVTGGALTLILFPTLILAYAFVAWEKCMQIRKTFS